MEEGKVAVVEDPEELVPGCFFEALLLLAEIEAENAASASPGAGNGGTPAALFSPAPDFIVISGGGGLAHRLAPGKPELQPQRE